MEINPNYKGKEKGKEIGIKAFKAIERKLIELYNPSICFMEPRHLQFETRTNKRVKSAYYKLVAYYKKHLNIRSFRDKLWVINY